MYSALTKLSGFGYEDGVPTCPEDVWNSYIAKHRNGAKFKKHKLENFDELDELYSKSAATGAPARKAASLLYDYTGKMQSESTPLPPSLSLPPSLRPSPSPGPSAKPTNKKPANSESSKPTNKKPADPDSSSAESEPVTAKRRRRKKESSSESDGGKPQKKPRKEKASTTGKATTKKASQAGVKTRAERSGKEKRARKRLAGSIEEVADVSRQVDFRLERAVELFHEEYHDRFSLRERFAGANLLDEDKNARIFLSLPEDDRDFWIEQMIQGAL
jgi:type IV secretory pathway VirB10-like protein